MLYDLYLLKNVLFQWLSKLSSTWISSAPITVDTFFMLSGILAVYTTVGKISRGQFLNVQYLFNSPYPYSRGRPSMWSFLTFTLHKLWLRFRSRLPYINRLQKCYCWRITCQHTIKCLYNFIQFGTWFEKNCLGGRRLKQGNLAWKSRIYFQTRLQLLQVTYLAIIKYFK